VGLGEARSRLAPEVSLACNDGLGARKVNGADCMWVDLSEGRMLGVPLAWFPACFTHCLGP